MIDNLREKIRKSELCKDGNVNSTDEILAWVDHLKKDTFVNITATSIDKDSFWFYDEHKGEITNRNRSFFSITGIRYFVNDKYIAEQPIFVQNEIGYVGIIAKEIDGVLNFLMQAKIEPGNVNCVQLSPTIQATKSNFMRAHGGRAPLYLDWFENANQKGKIIYDQIQSEQGNRFAGKRNRNIIILTNEEVPLSPHHKWMTLGQIKDLIKQDNLVNMDTRTVLSGLLIPAFSQTGFEKEGSTDEMSGLLYNTDAYAMLNEYKMYHDVCKTFVPLKELTDWKVDNYGVTCKNKSDFNVRYYDIDIHGREVQKWTQPLFEATSSALFVLFMTRDNGVRKFLITLSPEIGCFDRVEFGPSIQIPNRDYLDNNNPIHKIFLKHEKDKSGIITDAILSEEGGRFYHEQNRNMIIEIDKNELESYPNSLWLSMRDLSLLLINNNVLNIQLRNLIFLIDIGEEI